MLKASAGKDKCENKVTSSPFNKTVNNKGSDDAGI
jgi:hypothetical protein